MSLKLIMHSLALPMQGRPKQCIGSCHFTHLEPDHKSIVVFLSMINPLL